MLLRRIASSLNEYANYNSIFIDGMCFSYEMLKIEIVHIQQDLLLKQNTRNIGLIANDDLQTYASILAVLFSGKAYIPIDPKHPDDRNNSIIEQADIEMILSSDNSLLSKTFLDAHRSKIVEIPVNQIESGEINLQPASPDDLAYILFTSGSTGIPKGVPIRRKSLEAFVDAILSHQYPFTSNDKFLQVFDLTFDLSIFSFLIPLLHGACVYTIPKGAIRYAYAFTLLEEHQISVVLSVPSFLNFLKPYFPEINLPSLKYWFFCGEALYMDILLEWQRCIPNASIENVYGPTEATIFCTRYVYDPNVSFNKSVNGILSIGKPFPGVETMLVDEHMKMVPQGETGELCLSGDQVTEGYLHNVEKNKNSFFPLEKNGKSYRFYRTGDLCFQDNEGDYMFSGRLDTQVKIQGFRVELGEIENDARAFAGVHNAVALTHTDDRGSTTVHLFIEPSMADTDRLHQFLKTKLPAYMLPKQIYCLNQFPLNVNGKIDKPELKKKIIS